MKRVWWRSITAVILSLAVARTTLVLAAEPDRERPLISPDKLSVDEWQVLLKKFGEVETEVPRHIQNNPLMAELIVQRGQDLLLKKALQLKEDGEAVTPKKLSAHLAACQAYKHEKYRTHQSFDPPASESRSSKPTPKPAPAATIVHFFDIILAAALGWSLLGYGVSRWTKASLATAVPQLSESLPAPAEPRSPCYRPTKRTVPRDEDDGIYCRNPGYVQRQYATAYGSFDRSGVAVHS